MSYNLAPSTEKVALNRYESAVEAVYADGEERLYPWSDQIEGEAEGLANTVIDLFADSPAEDHTNLLVQSVIGGVHSAIQRLEKLQDAAADQVKTLTRNFDGSEIVDVELQEATAKLHKLMAAVAGFEMFRDVVSSTYTLQTGEVWTPWKGSSRKGAYLTASMMQAKAVLRQAELDKAEAARPGQEAVVFRAAPWATAEADYRRIYAWLDRAHAKHPQMFLVVCSNTGGDYIAIQWALAKRITIVTDTPDFKRHKNAANFRVNETMLKHSPHLVLTLPQSLDPVVAGDRTPMTWVLNLGQTAEREGWTHHSLYTSKA